MFLYEGGGQPSHGSYSWIARQRAGNSLLLYAHTCASRLREGMASGRLRLLEPYFSSGRANFHFIAGANRIPDHSDFRFEFGIWMESRGKKQERKEESFKKASISIQFLPCLCLSQWFHSDQWHYQNFYGMTRSTKTVTFWKSGYLEWGSNEVTRGKNLRTKFCFTYII